MRTAHVRLTALLFAVGLCLAAAGSAWFTHRGAPAPLGGPAEAGVQDGRALFELDCSRCHALEEVTPSLRGPDRGAAMRELLVFLDEHGHSDAREDRAIVAYLLEAAR